MNGRRKSGDDDIHCGEMLVVVILMRVFALQSDEVVPGAGKGEVKGAVCGGRRGEIHHEAVVQNPGWTGGVGNRFLADLFFTNDKEVDRDGFHDAVRKAALHFPGNMDRIAWLKAQYGTRVDAAYRRRRVHGSFDL